MGVGGGYPRLLRASQTAQVRKISIAWKACTQYNVGQGRHYHPIPCGQDSLTILATPHAVSPLVSTSPATREAGSGSASTQRQHSPGASDDANLFQKEIALSPAWQSGIQQSGHTSKMSPQSWSPYASVPSSGLSVSTSSAAVCSMTPAMPNSFTHVSNTPARVDHGLPHF